MPQVQDPAAAAPPTAEQENLWATLHQLLFSNCIREPGPAGQPGAASAAAMDVIRAGLRSLQAPAIVGEGVSTRW